MNANFARRWTSRVSVSTDQRTRVASLRAFRLWLKQLRGGRADCVALLTGMVAALALPPVFALPVLLLAVPVLLLLVDASPGVWVAARRGWWA